MPRVRMGGTIAHLFSALNGDFCGKACGVFTGEAPGGYVELNEQEFSRSHCCFLRKLYEM